MCPLRVAVRWWPCAGKHSRIKQHYKEERALRAETVVNDTYDFDVGRRLKNLEVLKAAGFAANRRLLGVQRISHDCSIGGKRFDDLHASRIVAGQRASSLRFGDPERWQMASQLVTHVLIRDAGFTLPAHAETWEE